MDAAKVDSYEGAAPTPSQGAVQTLRRLLSVNEVLLFIVVLLLLIGGTLANPNLISGDNLKVMTRDIAILGIAGLGLVFRSSRRASTCLSAQSLASAVSWWPTS
jgi:ribose/xylose/arabinose/galactoside ABC-type transport system permease subunit